MPKSQLGGILYIFPPGSTALFQYFIIILLEQCATGNPVPVDNNKKHCAAITPIMPGQTSTSEWRLIRTTNEGDWMK